jgi:hypothetical protein
MIVKLIDRDDVPDFVCFVDCDPGWGADDADPNGRRARWTVELHRRPMGQGSCIRYCGHDHRQRHTAEAFGRRLLRELAHAVRPG